MQTVVGRAIYSRTIARPGFAQSSASVLADPGTGIVTTGNPNLKPTTSQNFDLQIEKYLPHGGIISLGAFDKAMSDSIRAHSSTPPHPPCRPGASPPLPRLCLPTSP